MLCLDVDAGESFSLNLFLRFLRYLRCFAYLVFLRLYCCGRLAEVEGMASGSLSSKLEFSFIVVLCGLLKLLDELPEFGIDMFESVVDASRIWSLCCNFNSDFVILILISYYLLFDLDYTQKVVYHLV